MSLPYLRVATWNINGGILEPTNSSERHFSPEQEIARTLAAHEAELVALQEVPYYPQERLPGRFVSTVAQLAGYPFVTDWPLSPSHHPSSEAIGIAVLSRYKTSATSQLQLPNPRLEDEDDGSVLKSHDKGVLYVRVDTPHGVVTFASCHLLPLSDVFRRNPFEPRFAPIWTALSQSLEPLLSEPSLVCGDFNTDRLPDLMPRVIGEGKFRPLLSVPTRDTGDTDDNILVSPHWRQKEVLVVNSASNHHLCLASVSPLS